MLQNLFLYCACIFFGTQICQAQVVNAEASAPDVSLKNLFNDKRDSLKLSDFRGKLVILDFWSTHCGGCIASFARLDSLQKKFEGKIQILFINQESKKETASFFQLRKKLRLPRAPFITADTILNALFPHHGVPYSVWIDTIGRVLFSTQGYTIADWSINKYFRGENLQVGGVSSAKYIHGFIEPQWLPSVRYGSYITRNIPGINLEVSDDVKGCVQLVRDHSSVIDLYKTAFSEYTRYDFDRPGRLELKIKNLFPYVKPDHADSSYIYWLEDYCYNYHLIWPEEKKDELYRVMQSDLQRFFPLKAKVVDKQINCLALVRTNSEDKLKTKGRTPFINLYVVSEEMVYPGPLRKVVNQPFPEFAQRLETVVEQVFKIPFIDLTNYSGNIDFEIEGALWDAITLQELKKYLGKYGLDLIEKPFVLPVLVISE